MLHLILIILNKQMQMCNWCQHKWCQCQNQMYQMAKKSCWISFWLSWLNKCNGGIDDTFDITWCWCQWDHMTKKSFPFNHLDLRNGMVSLMILLASCDTVTSINGIIWSKTFSCTLFQSLWPNKWCHWQCHQFHVVLTLVPTASHDQKSHVTLCFNCLYIMKKIVPLMIQLALHDSSSPVKDWNT